MTIKYKFFGKDCFIDRELSNRSELGFALQKENILAKRVLFVNQVHGNQVIVVDDFDKIHGDQNLPKADALVTNLPNIAIGIITADCGPLLFFDSEKKIIGAAHAGWRGARLGVIAAIIDQMKKLGAQNIEAIIGPMIQQKSYEVSQELVGDFLNENLLNKEFFVDGVSTGKYWFDLPSYIERKVILAGVKKVNNLRIDTYLNESEFFSFRRSTHRGEKDCGRNVSLIVIE